MQVSLRNQSKCEKKIEKKMWLLLFFMAVATEGFLEVAIES